MQPIEASPAALRQLAFRWPDRYPVLYDSAIADQGDPWTVVTALPAGHLALGRDGRLVTSESDLSALGAFLPALERWWQRDATPVPELAAMPWRGGFSVFLGYELGAEIEPRLKSMPRSSEPWLAWAIRVQAAVVHQHRTGRSWLLTEPSARHSRREALQQLESDLQAAAMPVTLECASGAALTATILAEDAPELYLRQVEAAREYIRAGEIYQINLSRAWRGEREPGTDLAALYQQLRSVNPAPFAAFAQWRGQCLLSASPERLVHVDRGRINTRPIAGTRPRSGHAVRHHHETGALLASAKERAEHVMMIDLERNDLGRLCLAGTVSVDEFMALESYPHVHHIVSSISGALRPAVTPIDVIRAVFPGGTITGCPKIRCMELIASIENEGRGAYTGSLGTIGLDGRLDLNILIRTLVATDSSLQLRTGAGIVADSVAELELEETRAKARGVLDALRVAS